MRWQQKIYNQSGNKVRNRDLLNVNTSSDLCMFIAPTFGMSGATKIVTDSDSCVFASLSDVFSFIFTGATTSCSLSASCIDINTWSTRIYADGEIQYSGDFATTVSASTPLPNQFYNEMEVGLNSLGYSYTFDGSTLTVNKPYGVSDLQIDICSNITPIVSAICSTSCVTYCESACTQSFDTFTSASTGAYIVEDLTGETVDLVFNFTGNTGSFTDDSQFKFEIYKYNHNNLAFINEPIWVSDKYNYADFSATSSITETIVFSELGLDGDYLIKGYYVHDVCTDILGRLGLKNDTSLYKGGSQYNLYSPSIDYYFAACTHAEEPFLTSSAQAPYRPLGNLLAFSVLLDGTEQTYTIPTNTVGDVMIYLNGLMLAEDLDYDLNNSVVTFSGTLVSGDVLTYVSVSNGETNGIVVDNIYIDDVIPSGVTNGQADNKVYYNTDQDKYEIYTELTPVDGNDIVVTLNGVTLAPNIDYYQSISNPKRIILGGNLLVGDVINIIYNAWPAYVGEIYTNNPTIYWTIPEPQLSNGYFTVQVATDVTFSSIVSSARTDYVAGNSSYSAVVTVTGNVGTNLVYRVCNDKKYVTVNGDTLDSRAYSETVPITIMSNAINSY